MSFVHLHVHSNYSFCRGASRLEDLVVAARRRGMDAMALTDTNGLYGLVVEFMKRGTADAVFVKRGQFRRVLQVFVPTLLYLPATEWLGLYVASFLLIAGFMHWVGRLKPWISIVTALVFSVAMFVTFEVAFDVLMPKGPLERMLGY